MTKLKELYKKSAFRRQVAVAKRAIRIAALTARQNRLVRQKSHLPKLKVAFVVLTESSWKLEPLLRRMEADKAFDTAIVVTPLLSLDENLRRVEQENTRSYFERRGDRSAVLTRAQELQEFDPDVVFLTNPHKLTHPDFYDRLFKNKLCCYVPYTHGVDQYHGNQDQYNKPFHNAIWRIYAPHEVSKQVYQAVSFRKGQNVVVTGYPACEPLLSQAPTGTSVWKAQPREKLKVIWAPHHTIDAPELPYANFLRYADAFVELAERHKNEVQWALKPHPLLKSKLLDHADWGKERTERFFEYWNSADHCQLEEGGYADLFLQSDAMIHDSASFLAEYLYLDKPVQFLQGVDNIHDFFNAFGSDAFDACSHAREFSDVEVFLEGLIGAEKTACPKRTAFHHKHIDPYFKTSPSEAIIADLKSMFPNIGRRAG